MHDCSCNVVFLALVAPVVIGPGAALQVRGFRTGTGAPGSAQGLSCENKPSLEFYLDSLSWKLYESKQWQADGGNLSMREVAPSQNNHGEFDQAKARLDRFVQAVDKYHVNRTMGQPVGAAGSRNHSKSMSKATIEKTDGSAYCCHHLTDNDPYWQETEKYHLTHPGYIKCDYSDGCTRKVTNSMRVKSIRRALSGARQIFSNLKVQSLLYGGSAIGQYRCGDVIPWDVDCDVLVSQADIEVIHEKVFNEKIDFSKWEEGETSVDLAHFGAPGIRLIKKNPCAPFEIVDTQDGFFCDVFSSNWYASELYTPWWNAPYSCPGLFADCDKAGGGQRCFKFDAHTVRPAVNCNMAGVGQSCVPDMPTYLRAIYGNSWHTPNQTLGLSRD